jgi:hypothetical protein
MMIRGERGEETFGSLTEDKVWAILGEIIKNESEEKGAAE